MKRKPHPALFVIAFILAGVFGWMGLRPIPAASEFQTVTGKVVSATATSEKGANKFEIRIWIEGQPKVAYRVAAKVGGEVLGTNLLGPGVVVEMQALKKEIETPFTGLLHNVDPSIEVSALMVDGKPMSTWDDYRSYEQSQKNAAIGLSIGCIVLGIFGIIAVRKAAKN